ncbi:hypothetical protein C8Q80DRAFT_1265136 [Daedaleopsis nitida]|nr:hypothetical protein C8Q80DRAFT_1265136 [Daedaleopsis nitida]
MRAAFALFLVAALSSGVAVSSPVPAPASYNSHVYPVSNAETAPDSSTPRLHPNIGTKVIQRSPVPDHNPTLNALAKVAPRELLRRALDTFTAGGNAYSGSTGDVSGGGVANGGTFTHAKRTDDNGTLGGNAYTGDSGDVDGGDVVNKGDNFGMPTMLNMNSNNAGSGGTSAAGCAIGGHGNQRGSGGNAHSGDSGEAIGGSVWNSGAVMNVDSNNAGGAGTSQTGCATGGDVSDGDPAMEK